MLAALLPLCDALVFTSSQNPRALPPPTLQSLAGQLEVDDSRAARISEAGGGPARGEREPAMEIVADPRAALERARELAIERHGRDGVVLATGSIYLIADLLRPASEARASAL